MIKKKCLRHIYLQYGKHKTEAQKQRRLSSKGGLKKGSNSK